jgi:twitching motility protein PilT
VLVTGSTGSGKSTTLAAIIDFINRNRRDHILTVEDPIEFVHQNKGCLINQREISSHTESFASALRAALREDPDVILVGEMRDLETIELAMTAAETGHLVFGTLHTSSAAKTVDRIIDAFPPGQQAQIRTMLSESLKGVIAQQLLKRADKAGRIAAIEILFVNVAIANLIREGKTFQIPSMIQMAKADGMQLLDQAIMELLMQKIVSPDEAYVKANDKKPFERFLKQI